MTPFLVIGFGNDLRGDDAVGRHVVRIVASWQSSDVRVLEVQQLTPELVEPLSRADRVIFVDARMNDPEKGVELISLESAIAEEVPGHRSDPVCLLELTDALYCHRPRAWLLTVPAAEFRLGDGLSARARAGAAEALRRITQWTNVTCDISGDAGDA